MMKTDTPTIVKERPILFSGPMVRATLEDRKTQTRRVLKGLPSDAVPAGQGSMQAPDGVIRIGDIDGLGYTPVEIKCPYGKPGERLWVRETWALWDAMTARGDTEGDLHRGKLPKVETEEQRVFWHSRVQCLADGQVEDMTWRPSIFMPRWASRLTLEVVKVRVERLQDISEADILAEGVTVDGVAKLGIAAWGDMPTLHHAWRVLWESVNGEGSWDKNPWVWVVEFKRV